MAEYTFLDQVYHSDGGEECNRHNSKALPPASPPPPPPHLVRLLSHPAFAFAVDNWPLLLLAVYVLLDMFIDYKVSLYLNRAAAIR